MKIAERKKLLNLIDLCKSKAYPRHFKLFFLKLSRKKYPKNKYSSIQLYD